MANIRGMGGAAQRNVVGTAKFFPKMVEKDGKKVPDASGAGKYLCDFRVDMRDERTKAARETNPHLHSHKYTPPAKDGVEQPEVMAHGNFYSKKQVEAIMAAGESRKRKDGTIELAVKADLMAKDGSVLVRTDRPLAKSDFKLTSKTMSEQDKLMAAAKEAVKAERASEKAAPEAGTPEVATPQPEAELE